MSSHPILWHLRLCYFICFCLEPSPQSWFFGNCKGKRRFKHNGFGACPTIRLEYWNGSLKEASRRLTIEHRILFIVPFFYWLVWFLMECSSKLLIQSLIPSSFIPSLECASSIPACNSSVAVFLLWLQGFSSFIRSFPLITISEIRTFELLS